jgi:ataxin-3
LQEHWFTIRKVDGDWWNFNSLYPAPESLSAFYLTAYLDSLKQQGYTVFVIRGNLPASPAATGTQDMDGPGKWWSPEEVGANQLQIACGICL